MVFELIDLDRSIRIQGSIGLCPDIQSSWRSPHRTMFCEQLRFGVSQVIPGSKGVDPTLAQVCGSPETGNVLGSVQHPAPPDFGVLQALIGSTFNITQPPAPSDVHVVGNVPHAPFGPSTLGSHVVVPQMQLKSGQLLAPTTEYVSSIVIRLHIDLVADAYPVVMVRIAAVTVKLIPMLVVLDSLDIDVSPVVRALVHWVRF
jgi:hypothetical protein